MRKFDKMRVVSLSKFHIKKKNLIKNQHAEKSELF